MTIMCCRNKSWLAMLTVEKRIFHSLFVLYVRLILVFHVHKHKYSVVYKLKQLLYFRMECITGSSPPIIIYSTMVQNYCGTEPMNLSIHPRSFSCPSTSAVKWLRSGCLATNSHLWSGAQLSYYVIAIYSLLYQLSQKANGRASRKVPNCWGKCLPPT